jgi:hypothetical protein
MGVSVGEWSPPVRGRFDILSGGAMLYIAYVKARSDASDGALMEERSREWWNNGARPAGLRTVGIFGCIGTASPDIFVFDADSHDEIQTMVDYWRGVAELEVHPAVDLAERFQSQGMNIA